MQDCKVGDPDCLKAWVKKFVFGTSIGLTYPLVRQDLDEQEMLLELTLKGQREIGVSPVGTLRNHNDAMSVRVEDFPAPDAKMVMEVMVIAKGSVKSQSLSDVAGVGWRRLTNKISSRSGWTDS